MQTQLVCRFQPYHLHCNPSLTTTRRLLYYKTFHQATTTQLHDFKQKNLLLPSLMPERISALARFVFHCRRRSPVGLLFSRGCHEAECESKHVWPTLSSILSICL